MSRIDDLNYFRDPRNCDRAEVPTVYLGDEKVELPWHWEVCPVCGGKGTHVNPSIDAGGLTGEDFAEDPDFAEGYFSGMYDQTCNYCGGRTTVPAVDEDRLTSEQREALEAQDRADAEIHAERMMEIRMGC